MDIHILTYNKGEENVKLRLLPLLLALILVPAVYAQDTYPSLLSFELFNMYHKAAKNVVLPASGKPIIKYL